MTGPTMTRADQLSTARAVSALLVDIAEQLRAARGMIEDAALHREDGVDAWRASAAAHLLDDIREQLDWMARAEACADGFAAALAAGRDPSMDADAAAFVAMHFSRGQPGLRALRAMMQAPPEAPAPMPPVSNDATGADLPRLVQVA